MVKNLNVRCLKRKKINYLDVAISFRMICLFKLESIVFQVKVGVALFDLESLGPIYNPSM